MVRDHTVRLSGLRPLSLFGMALGAVALAGCVYERIWPGITDQHIGQMTGSQAAASARKLTTTISGAGAAETISVSGVGNSAPPGTSPRWCEWQVSCLTAAGGYFVCINANSGETMVVLREHEADDGAAPTANGDLHSGVSHREAMLWARRYLRLAGLPVPAGERPFEDHGFDFTFRIAVAPGAMRVLRVGVNPRDGSLEHLFNLVHWKFRPARWSQRARAEDRFGLG